ncbi:hypothetical protein [Nocardia sp. CA-290969]|uniref:hypothetical protein n=1 Tax=Nocardia sp. CA-290969 TaxID=3239986 RepID=UPI003D8E2E7D
MSLLELALASVLYAFVGATVIGAPSAVIYALWLHLGARVDASVRYEESLELDLERAA